MHKQLFSLVFILLNAVNLHAMDTLPVGARRHVKKEVRDFVYIVAKKLVENKMAKIDFDIAQQLVVLRDQESLAATLFDTTPHQKEKALATHLEQVETLDKLCTHDGLQKIVFNKEKFARITDQGLLDTWDKEQPTYQRRDCIASTCLYVADGTCCVLCPAATALTAGSAATYGVPWIVIYLMGGTFGTYGVCRAYCCCLGAREYRKKAAQLKADNDDIREMIITSAIEYLKTLNLEDLTMVKNIKAELKKLRDECGQQLTRAVEGDN